MANYDDYRLEDAEDAAMKTSQTTKRVALGAAATVAVGGTAMGASIMNDNGEALSQSDVDGGLNAGAVSDEVLDPVKETVPAHTVNTDNVTVHDVTEPELKFTSSTDVIDSDTGEYVGGYDTGTYDGKDFVIIDEDGDGRADTMAYDVNGDRIFQADEMHVIDNDTDIPIGNSDNYFVKTTNQLAHELYGDGVPQNDYTEEYDLAAGTDDYDDTLPIYPAEEYVADTDLVEEYPEMPAPAEEYIAESDIIPDDTTIDTVDLV